jgi:glycosyltransferase involved in cell wall biosynthesis
MSSRLKIAVVAACPFPYPRGTPIRILRLAEALANRGHDLHVVTYHLGEGEPEGPVKVHRIRDVAIYRRVSPGPSYLKLLLLDPLLALKLKSVVVGAPVRRSTGCPLVYDAHTLLESELHYYGLGLWRNAKRSIGRRLDRWLPKWADHVVTVTDRIRQGLIRDTGLSPEGVTLVTNGVETDLFGRQRGRNGSSVPAHRTVVFAGNLARYQGIEHLLQAFGKILEKRKGVRLRIVTQSSFDEYESMARDLGIRESIDVVDSDFEGLPDELAAADVLVNPRTECDGIPMKLLNYMAARKAIVSFQGSAPCVEHGKTALVVEDRDTRAFAGSVLRLLDDPGLAEELGRRAREVVEAKHTWDSKAAAMEVIFGSLLAGGATR